MAVLGVFVLLIPLGLPLLLLGIAAAVDLVRRDVGVPVWWVIPLIPWTGMLPLVFGVALLTSGPELYTALGWLGGTLWMGAAGNLLLGSMALAVSRGLQPDGPTERRVRTTIGAALLLGAVPLGVVLLSVLVPQVLVLAWTIPAGWGGLIWVLLLNRRGPERLERGRRVSATWLAASGLLFVGAILHFLTSMWVDEGLGIGVVVVAAMGIAGTLVLVAGLRLLAGPLQRKVLGASLLSWVTVFVPVLGWSLYRAVPAGTELPAWVDLAGDEPELYAYRTHTGCVFLVPSNTVWGDCDTWSRDSAPVAAAPDTPMPAIPSMREVLVDDGIRGLWYAGPTHGVANVDVGPDGVLTVAGVRHPDRRAAHDAIRALPQVDLAYNDRVTVQTWVEVCGSFGWLGSCTLVEPPPPPLPTPPTEDRAELLKFLLEDVPLEPMDTDSL